MPRVSLLLAIMLVLAALSAAVLMLLALQQIHPRYYSIQTDTQNTFKQPIIPDNTFDSQARELAIVEPITDIAAAFDATRAAVQSPNTITIRATGDVLLARSVTGQMLRNEDFSWPFAHTKTFLQEADSTFINLETPLIADCPVRDSGMIFCGDLRSVSGLQAAGVHVITIANNHASNYGPEGVATTVQALTDAGFLVTGAAEANVVYQEIQGSTIAYLGFNEVNEQPGITRAETQTVIRDISAARQQADIVIAQFHWGNEYTYTPSANQRRLARVAVDAGADLVLGNHPHWIQPIEFYRDTLIVYSHGNFVFDQMWSEETRTGIIGSYTFSNAQLVGVTFTPIRIYDYGQPKILEGSEAAVVLEVLKQESNKLVAGE